MASPIPANPASKTLGISLVLLSTVGLALQNVILRLLFTPSSVIGWLGAGGWVSTSFGNVVFLLALRMVLMTLFVAAAARTLYAPTLGSLGRLLRQPPLLTHTLASGLCLFLGQVCLYRALSLMATGVAIAIFFIYPVITVLLAWGLFSQRPRPYQLWLIPVITLGVVLTAFDPTDASVGSYLGVLWAAGAGLSFGFYGIFTEISLRPDTGLHPVPFSLAVFAMVAVLSSLTVLLIGGVHIAAASRTPVLICSIISALLTLVAYLLNNFGIGYIGAALTALLSSSTPVLSGLFAWWLLQEALHPQQQLGVLLVTLGIGALSLKLRS